MKSFMPRLAFAAALLLALFGACRSSFATTVHPGDSFDISYHAAMDPFPPWGGVQWDLYLLSPKSALVNVGIQVDVFNSANHALGSELATYDYSHEPALDFYPELFWNTGTSLTSDLTGRVHFTIVSGTFDIDLSRSSAVLIDANSPGGRVIPVPAALPLFASGLGLVVLLSRGRRRTSRAQ